jgi:uncharacterized membrane protein
MTKEEYLSQLASELKKLPAAEVHEILADYREHFDVGTSAQKTDDEIASSLGHPRTVAQGYFVSHLVKDAKNTSSPWSRLRIACRIMLMILVLAPFNFLVIVGPFVVVFSLALAGWSVPLALGAVSVTVTGALLAAASELALGMPAILSVVFLMLGLLGISVLGVLLMILASKAVIQLVVSYLRWNVELITARRG